MFRKTLVNHSLVRSGVNEHTMRVAAEAKVVDTADVFSLCPRADIMSSLVST